MSHRKPAEKATAESETDRLFAEEVKALKATPDLTAAYEKWTIEAAKGGDHKAGIEVLRLCAEALDTGRRSIELSTYIRRAIAEIQKGLPKNTTAEQISALAARALHLRPERQRGKPANGFPDWETPLGAFAAILTLRDHGPENVLTAMNEARMLLENKPLGRTEAQRIRSTYAPLLKPHRQEYGADGKLSALTPATHEEDLIHMMLTDNGRPRLNAKDLLALLGKYPRMT